MSAGHAFLCAFGVHFGMLGSVIVLPHIVLYKFVPPTLKMPPQKIPRRVKANMVEQLIEVAFWSVVLAVFVALNVAIGR